MKRNILAFTTVAVVLLFAHSAIAGPDNALFIAYKNQNTQSYQQWHKKMNFVFKEHHCQLFRKGLLVGNQGNLQWKDVNQFVVMRCATPVLSQLVTSGHYKSLSKFVDNALMIEGIINIISGEKQVPSGDAEYIIKISHFNNLAPKDRAEDLTAIGQSSKKISSAWTNDAILVPRAAIGIIRPDELTFLYYPQPGQGEEFRKNNPDILKKIQAFNQKHVYQFNYLFGRIQ